MFLGNRIKEGQGSHSGPGAKPTVQSRSPDFAYSHATMNIDFYRKKFRLCYYCYECGGRGEGSNYLFRFSRAFSVNVPKEFNEDIESTVGTCVLSGEFSVP